MKNSLTNPVKYNKIIIMETILLTLGIHLLFFYIFSVPEVRHHNTAKENTTVTLLRMDSSESGTAKMENFIRKYNPAHFSNPKSPMGYNSFRKAASASNVKMSPLYNQSFQVKSLSPANNFALPQCGAKNILLPRRDIPAAKQSVLPKLDYPFAVSSSGIVIPLTFSTDEQRMIDEFPLSSGVYKVFKPSDKYIIRLALLQSCGRRALDRLSLKNLQQEITRLSNCNDGEIFTVFYREPEFSGGAQ